MSAQSEKGGGGRLPKNFLNSLNLPVLSHIDPRSSCLNYRDTMTTTRSEELGEPWKTMHAGRAARQRRGREGYGWGKGEKAREKE